MREAMHRYRIDFIVMAFVLLAIFVVSVALISESGSAADDSSDCKENATKLLDKEKSEYDFTRCEQETFNAQNGQSLTRIRVVSGEITEQWEHECGYLAACSIFVGWFDHGDNMVEFVDAPEVANHDPAVYTLGCGDVNSSSVFDTKVEPNLVFENEKYWWEIDYKNTVIFDANNSEIENQKVLCEINGTSMIGKTETLSSVEVVYFSTDECDSEKTSTCRTVDALKNESASSCIDADSSEQDVYDFECARNLIAQTGNTELCGVVAKYGARVNCELIPSIKEL